MIATGGCAFLSRALGSNVLTGDGGLLAAEVGAELSGMEFSSNRIVVRMVDSKPRSEVG
jgi:succinate dehydrogenase/fumarate reductase flavoprotein subunit